MRCALARNFGSLIPMARFAGFLVATPFLYLTVHSSSAQNINPKEFYDPKFPAIPSFDNPSNADPQRVFEPKDIKSTTGAPTATANISPAPESGKIIPPGVTIDTSVVRTYSASIDVAVNCLDTNHSTEVLGTVRRLAAQKRARFSTIYCLGATPSSISQELKSEFLHYGIMIGSHNKVPVDVEVTQSPVWIFAAPTGKVVVEGIMNIERFLGVDGGFQGKVEQPVSPPVASDSQEPR
jgi:hypothetical protein